MVPRSAFASAFTEYYSFNLERNNRIFVETVRPETLISIYVYQNHRQTNSLARHAHGGFQGSCRLKVKITPPYLS